MNRRQRSSVLCNFFHDDGSSCNSETIVYLVISPNSGPEYRLFVEEDKDILAVGGVHAVERELESDSDWFIRLGVIKGKLDRKGLTFDNAAFARLPEPSEKARKTGWLNPAFGKSEVEKVVLERVQDNEHWSDRSLP